MTFTQEQLQQIEATAKEVLWPIIWTPLRARKHFEEKITPEVVLALARMALAGMKAQPVGVTDKSEIECLKRGEMANVMPPDYKGCDSGDSVYLYAAPQPLTTSERAELENYRNAQHVVPDDYCIMPMKLTAGNGAKGALSGEFHITHRIICQSCGGEGCDDCNEDGGWDAEIPIGWDTIKRIHEAAVEACALPAAPQQEAE